MQDPKGFNLWYNDVNITNMYLLPILHHLTCKPPFYCKCSLGTINSHSKLDINTLYQKLERISVKCL